MKKDIHCEQCSRYLFTAFGTVVLRITCPNRKCKHKNEVKVVSSDQLHDLRFDFSAAEAQPSSPAN